ncbi:MAG TPA: FKBP-type peptidyl-prolyl cis-trans isomerase [Solirubrobacteraceae bacterium]|nr:FKBP-type peptidyl-prolyl cis-trans isomerase [Solirubrobacteraceae bacterium]
MSSLKTFLPTLRVCVLMLCAAFLIAGCGSSKPSSTITIGNESATVAPTDSSTSTTDSSASTSTAASAPGTTPASGPLSKRPKVKPPKGKAPSKLVTKDIIKGSGAEAKSGASVSVNYVGVLYHGGKAFDASWNRNQPFTFVLGQGQVIPGWDQGVAGMKVGGRRELIIPAALGYGAQGSPPAIPPNAPLVFVVDLLSA